jgi:2-phospho-L-lactate guanylyltransferase
MTSIGTEPWNCWALVPLKAVSGAKSRLAQWLSPEQRAHLQLAMLTDVLTALTEARSLAGILVVTGDDTSNARITSFGACAFRERLSGDLDEAVRQGIAHLRVLGARHALVVAADLPLLDPAEVDRAVWTARAARRGLVVPSHDRAGTNGLLFDTCDPPSLAYGPRSFERHMHAFHDQTPCELALPSFALDVDTPADILNLSAQRRATRFHSPRGATMSWISRHWPLVKEQAT